MATALDRDQRAVRRLGQCSALAMRTDRVLLAVNDEARALNASAHVDEALDAAKTDGAARIGECHRVGVETPTDAVFDLLRRVRLREALAEKELEEALVVAQPVMAVVLRPTIVGVELIVERHIS